MRWYKIGVDNHLSESHGRSVIYVIESVTEKDAGKYMCVIKRAIVNYAANDTIVITSQGIPLHCLQRVVPLQTFDLPIISVTTVRKLTDCIQSIYRPISKQIADRCNFVPK